MKMVHISDTHLGFAAYRRTDPATGLNQREMDVYRAFEECVDRILQLRPEAVIHSGDLFDTVRPSNRAISFALEQLIRLKDQDIEVVMIAGNHSTPKMRETGSVFKIFEHLDRVHPVYQGVYETVRCGDLAVHAVPHADRDDMIAQLDRVRPDGDSAYNVLTLHAGIVGITSFGMGEFNEQLIPSSYLREDMDYVALGHFHESVRLADNSYYAGSIERFSFNEAGHRKGFMLVDLEKGKKDFIEIGTRKMLDLPPIDAKGMEPNQLMKDIRKRLESQDLDGAIVRLRVDGVRSSLYRSLDFEAVRSWTDKAVHFEPRFDIVSEEGSVQTNGPGITALD
ncbi:MAG TPA: exonuclease SbcCD subunit D, partial [Methanomassiliicoccales archaeon]|nr:exonuclease SbcCD subunit D [Methanomassiliicoccales archaeon]